MKVLISKKTGRKYLCDPSKDFHCKEGIIKKEDLESSNLSVYSHLRKEFLLTDANEYDYSLNLKRGPQILTNKDLGYILARTGIGRESRIVEAGGGSGAASIFFSKYSKEVSTYEIREEHIKIIEKNLDKHSSNNVSLTLGDLSEHIEKESSFDLLFLDLPDPNQILEKNLHGLKKGKYIVCYLPSITQISHLCELIETKDTLYLEEICEVNLREWKVWKKIARPHHRKEIDHTAFLVFIRKL